MFWSLWDCCKQLIGLFWLNKHWLINTEQLITEMDQMQLFFFFCETPWSKNILHNTLIT